ncbi:LIM and SH3 domain protein Lasp-like isoform X3 [Lytechinus variegatus]|uniref:LIM and SH3 domain protein Lasp-like isoform X3 n=1 Tax=Lytechinus variegatus TaxID=7654 RepID=UPI001BB21615|nr:LIM and SH3 domain protein Lasp-like isoform X3 [Lytechinus variegatus]
MNKSCARCQRTVYPVEMLKCLDKSWHKGCFTCEACGMTLNMKNYKGYNKLPYCHAHYPTTKFTTVADTPENRRLAKNTKAQSQVEYQKQFVQEKGMKISVADDPETMRAKKNTQNQSSVLYTGQLQQREQSELHRPPPETGTVTGFSFTPYSGPPGKQQAVGSLFDSKPQTVQSPPPAGQMSKKYCAIYDYTAADQDEVSFREGDLVINWQHIDEGWMTGTIERTGQTGMLPSNYVQLV